MTVQKSDGKSVVVIGATSMIARAAAMEFAARGYRIVVASRDREENHIIAADLRVRFETDAYAVPFEALAYDSHQLFYDQCVEALGTTPEGVLLCFGYLEDQQKAQDDFAVARKLLDINLTACVSVLEIFARKFEERGGGFIVGVSSVAGDRGRMGNYVYGCAKAGFSAYLQGLRQRLSRRNVSVLTVKPGFIDTKMTFGMPNLLLMASPETAGRDIVRAILKKRDVIYTPWFWRYIMLIIRHVPEFIFKRTKV